MVVRLLGGRTCEDVHAKEDHEPEQLDVVALDHLLLDAFDGEFALV